MIKNVITVLLVFNLFMILIFIISIIIMIIFIFFLIIRRKKLFIVRGRRIFIVDHFQFIIHNHNHIRRFQKRVPVIAQTIANFFFAKFVLFNNVNQTRKLTKFCRRSRDLQISIISAINSSNSNADRLKISRPFGSRSANRRCQICVGSSR